VGELGAVSSSDGSAMTFATHVGSNESGGHYEAVDVGDDDDRGGGDYSSPAVADDDGGGDDNDHYEQGDLGVALEDGDDGSGGSGSGGGAGAGDGGNV